MTKTKSIKSAMMLSALAMLLCVSLLVGSTFAWFTDSVQSNTNIIKSGNLDAELYWSTDAKSWTNVTNTTNVFSNEPWEPGHTEVIYFKLVNAGSLAFKYNFGVNVISETASINVENNPFVLSDYIKFGIIEQDKAEAYADRDDAVKAVADSAKIISTGYSKADTILATDDEDAKYLAMVVYMPTSVGNEANYKTDPNVTAPEIKLGISLFATQYTKENDSFGDDYDEDAPVVTYKVNPSNIQDYLDGKYTSLKNVKLVLEAGDYGVLYLGRPTKYAGNNSVYYCETHDYATMDAEDFKAHLADGQYHTTPRYTTTLEDLTIVGEDGAKVAGMLFSTGHSYGDVYDYVRDIDYDAGSAYYSTAYVSNVTIENVAFTGKVDINTSDANTVVDGVTFRNCSFTTGGTAAANGAAIRYYNENKNGNVKNLTVEGCEFTNCYQGIYAGNVNGVSIIGNTFDTLGHNAIALQGAGAVDLKAVVIKNNVMKNVADRVIRFNEIGADSQITIQYNAAVNSGDDAGEVIKATSIADGATFDVKYNDWGGKTVVNDQLKDAANTEAKYAKDNTALNDALNSGAETIILGSGSYIIPDSAKNKTLTIVGNGDTVVAAQDDGAAEGDCDYSFDGSTVTFENVTITTTTTYFPGYARMKGIYNNCTINGVWTLYDDSEFNNCTFNVSGDVYNVWTWGANTATFNNCTFNNDGKAVLLYGTANTKLTVNDCTFNDNGDDTVTGKAAIEIGNDYGKSYQLIIDDATVNGYAINSNGIPTGSTLWANKNSMGTDKLNVVIDGVDVY